ncbi:bacterial low temperature requirement A protein-domain-containing protein [Gilbertella persicaria]|uniref:bacterial low temperature requirement A protein-domain-containing protein n=1 Tax=Gilbertella persicaria TaxID=101096 RepID=UPI002220AF76|nr:bacterial low temperature requirement A protein-domain-containing protein [Gilbertella persicaria]KAI8082476.1 bacterial low temperature requirement A protein-domain-containing protein [Gilbertella persicaria]
MSSRYQGPSFGFSARKDGRQRQSIASNDEFLNVDEAARSRISSDSQRRPSQQSYQSRALSNRSRHSDVEDGTRSLNFHHHQHQPHYTNRTEAIEPLHDPAGKPLRRHGTDTIGDLLLHPLKELQLHHKRAEAYKVEKKAWDEKHPDSIAKDIETPNEVAIEEVKTRLIIHFRHLVSDHDFKFTEECLDALERPLDLTPEEKEKMRGFKDTDDLIDFLEKTKRDYSVKVHKTVNLKVELSTAKNELASAKSELFHKSSKSFDLGSRQNTTATASSDGSASTSDEKAPGTTKIVQGPQKSDSGNFTNEPTVQHPHVNRSDDDLLIDLNDNIYIQVQFIPMVHHEEENHRRAIFLLPDPDLSDEIGEETKATWTELLGDVFYVGWLSQFTHSVEINSVDNIGTYAAWFVVMWWTWCSSALYSSRYDRGDVAHHVYKIIELCGLILMAGSSDKARFEGSPKWFIIGYIIMKAVLLLEYSIVFIVSITTHVKSSRRPLGAYVVVSAISIAMWGASLIYVTEETMKKRYALWYSSIGLEILVHIFLQSNSRVSLAASHLGERFGLFTLIILGENCMGFIKMVAGADPTPSLLACNCFGVVIIFCYFFMYFDDFTGELMEKTQLSQLWMYLHFPLHLFQVAFGIALTDVIARHNLKQDTPEFLAQTKEECAAASANHSTATSEHATTTSEHSVVENAHYAIFSASAEAASGESELNCDPLFIIKAFWISAGLILCLNAFIKLVNTPIRPVTTYANLNALGMVSVMMCCLLFQSAVDLLD